MLSLRSRSPAVAAMISRTISACPACRSVLGDQWTDLVQRHPPRSALRPPGTWPMSSARAADCGAECHPCPPVQGRDLAHGPPRRWPTCPRFGSRPSSRPRQPLAGRAPEGIAKVPELHAGCHVLDQSAGCAGGTIGGGCCTPSGPSIFHSGFPGVLQVNGEGLVFDLIRHAAICHRPSPALNFTDAGARRASGGVAGRGHRGG